jgi:uncharacterized membrane protein YdbT with pleckstrin-like domain
MRCPACGVDVVESAMFCHRCGETISPGKTSEESPNPQEQFRTAAESRKTATGGEERDLWAGAFSPRAMIGNWVLTGIATLVAIIAWIVWMPPMVVWWALAGVVVVVWAYQVGVLMYRRMSQVYRLSTQRLIHESGLLRRTTDRIEVLDIDDITVEQGLVERMLGVGTIHISSSDRTHPDLRLRGIENVKEVATIFDNARLDERRRRSLHIEHI